MSKKNKKRIDVVYSTNANYNYIEEDEDNETLPPQEQCLTVSVDRKMRKGKSATLVKGFEGAEVDIKALGKELKSKCGVGGSVKDGTILIQGSVKEKVYDILIDLGYEKTKKIGG